MRGVIVNFEMLISVIVFSAVFLLFLLRSTVAQGLIENQYSAGAARMALESKVQSVLSSIEQSNLGMGEVRNLLNNSFGGSYLLTPLQSPPAPEANGIAVDRILPIDGSIYYLQVYENETPI